MKVQLLSIVPTVRHYTFFFLQKSSTRSKIDGRGTAPTASECHLTLLTLQVQKPFERPCPDLARAQATQIDECHLRSALFL